MSGLEDGLGFEFLRHDEQGTICGAGDSNIQVSILAIPPVQEERQEGRKA